MNCKLGPMTELYTKAFTLKLSQEADDLEKCIGEVELQTAHWYTEHQEYHALPNPMVVIYCYRRVRVFKFDPYQTAAR